LFLQVLDKLGDRVEVMNLACEIHKLAVGSTSDIKYNVDFVLDVLVKKFLSIRLGVVIVKRIG
jgi:hypothetical protein